MVKGLRQLVKEAGRWAGEHESWLQQKELRDSQSIHNPPIQRCHQDKHNDMLEVYWPGETRGH
eukprot:930878-Karenia_brevis.AAC.1